MGRGQGNGNPSDSRISLRARIPGTPRLAQGAIGKTLREKSGGVVEVTLKEDIPKLGTMGETVKVAQGKKDRYLSNYDFPL